MPSWPGPPATKTYWDFQQLSLEERLEALAWLKGRREPTDYFDDVMRMDRAANDNGRPSEGAMSIILDADFVNMLYCWESCGRDEFMAKLSYNDDLSY